MFKKNKRSSWYTIRATFASLLNYKNEKSSHIHSLSEFIDNSIASWLKEKSIDQENENVDGLQIDITIEPSGDTQTIQIRDNAGGMDDTELKNAIQPNNTKGKSDLQINQYGVGLKLATFYLGSGVEIITKKQKKNEYYLILNDIESRKNDEAKFEIEEKNAVHFKKNESGTIIKVLNVYLNPNRFIKKESIFSDKFCNGFGEICNGLGWRYGGLIKKGMKLSITYTDSRGSSKTKIIPAFSPQAYSLPSAKTAFELKKGNSIDFSKYKENLLQKIWAKYQLKKENIDRLTGNKNFYETLSNGDPLFFECDWTIENVETKVKWGILATRGSKENGSFSYKDLQGFTLLHKGRAIKHGPNKINANKTADEVNISTYSFTEEESSGQTAVRRRLFGEIDLTGIEPPEKNKSEFSYGPEGKNDINQIQGLIWTSLKDILNEMKDEEDSSDSIKISGRNATKKIRDSLEERFKNQILTTTNADANENGINIVLEIDGETNKFNIRHASANKDDDLFEYRNVTENSMEIIINLNNYLLAEILKIDDSRSQTVKSTLIYPLAIIYAICSVYQDKDVPFNNWKLFKGKKIPFSDFFNLVIKKIRGD